jgi:hypothetical protein
MKTTKEIKGLKCFLMCIAKAKALRMRSSSGARMPDRMNKLLIWLINNSMKRN